MQTIRKIDFVKFWHFFSDGLRNFIFLTVYVQNWVMTAAREMCTEVHFVHWILECDDKWSFLLKGKIMKKFPYPPVQNCNSVNLVKREKSMRMIGFEPGEFCHYWAQALTHCHFTKSRLPTQFQWISVQSYHCALWLSHKLLSWMIII